MPLIGPSIYHRTLDGVLLTKARERLGLSQEEFADKCGWSQPYQSQIEAPEEHEVHIEITDKIEKVIDQTRLDETRLDATRLDATRDMGPVAEM